MKYDYFVSYFFALPDGRHGFGRAFITNLSGPISCKEDLEGVERMMKEAGCPKDALIINFQRLGV